MDDSSEATRKSAREPRRNAGVAAPRLGQGDDWGLGRDSSWLPPDAASSGVAPEPAGLSAGAHDGEDSMEWAVRGAREEHGARECNSKTRGTAPASTGQQQSERPVLRGRSSDSGLAHRALSRKLATAARVTCSLTKSRVCLVLVTLVEPPFLRNAT